jgi:hypothetical protein
LEYLRIKALMNSKTMWMCAILDYALFFGTPKQQCRDDIFGMMFAVYLNTVIILDKAMILEGDHRILTASRFDGLAKIRHTGENRCPVFQQLSENTGFRLSPE